MYVPDGWFKYSRFGTPIEQTKIICVKTPLKQAFNNGTSRGKVLPQHLDHRGGVPTEEEFTPTQLVEQLKEGGWNLRAVIDLTFTSRYYNPKEFQDLGMQYSKVFCPGKEIPNDDVYSQFAKSLSDYLAPCENNDVVAVHCTHGLNRTGYLVCRYLMDKCQYSAEGAIHAFNEARGHDIERENYLEHLRKGCPPLPPAHKPPSQFHRKGDQGQHFHHRDISHSTWEPGHYNQQMPPAPRNQLQREAWGRDHHNGAATAAGHSSETRIHDRKKKHRKKRGSSRKPQPNPGSGPPSIPFLPDQIQPQGGDYYHWQNLSERDDRAHSKHPRRNKRHRNRQQPPYQDQSSTSMSSRTGSASNERDGFVTNDASYPVSSRYASDHDHDCMELEGLSTSTRNSSPWMQAHSRGRAGWQERGHHSMEAGPLGYGRSQSWSHDHDPDNSRYMPGGVWGDGYYEPYAYCGGGSYSRSDPYHWRPT